MLNVVLLDFRTGRAPKTEASEDQEPEEMITVDIYQNPERKNVVVEVEGFFGEKLSLLH